MFAPSFNPVKRIVGKYPANLALAGLMPDVWFHAATSFWVHGYNPRITQRDVILVVDYRIEAVRQRLWLVDLNTLSVVLKAKVAHGTNSGPTRGPATLFSNLLDYGNPPNRSTIGAFVTGLRRDSKAGKLGRRGPAMELHGLDATNSTANDRAILIHGASYMQNGRVGHSGGCLATDPQINAKILQLLPTGSFVYTYGGDLCPERGGRPHAYRTC